MWLLIKTIEVSAQRRVLKFSYDPDGSEGAAFLCILLSDVDFGAQQDTAILEVVANQLLTSIFILPSIAIAFSLKFGVDQIDVRSYVFCRALLSPCIELGMIYAPRSNHN